MKNNSKTVGIRLREDQVCGLKFLARKMAYEKNEKITLSSLVRDAIDKIYPNLKEKTNNK